MLKTDDYKAQVLEEFARRFEANHNSLADAYALIWAIDTYASLVAFETLGKDQEIEFKNELEKQCEAFGIIRSASNAIKHVERKNKDVAVYSMGDISRGHGPGLHAWFANGGKSEPSIAITVNWQYDPDTNEYRDGNGKIIPAPQSGWKTQYLRRLYRPAINEIEARLPKPDTTQ